MSPHFFTRHKKVFKPKGHQERSHFLMKLQKIWHDTVGTFATHEKETHQLFKSLADFGTLSKEESRRLFGQARHIIEENRKELDQRIEEGLNRGALLFSLPLEAELLELKEDISRKEQQVEALEKRLISIE